MLAKGCLGLKLTRVRGAAPTLLLFPGALGDAVCFEPTVARLAAEGPVTLCARLGAAEVAALYPARPRVESLDRREVAALFAPWAVAHPREDLGVRFLEGFARVRSFTGASSASLRERFALHRDARVAAFPARELAVHASHYFLRAALDDEAVLAPAPRLVLSDTPRMRHPPNLLVIHPGGGALAKRAPAEVFEEVARRWREAGGAVRFVLGPAEAQEVGIWRERGLDVVLPKDARALAAAMVGAAAFLGNDSGPSHVAAALGIPTTVYFIATDPASFGPRGAKVCWLDVRDAPREVAQAASRGWNSVRLALP